MQDTFISPLSESNEDFGQEIIDALINNCKSKVSLLKNQIVLYEMLGKPVQELEDQLHSMEQKLLGMNLVHLNYRMKQNPVKDNCLILYAALDQFDLCNIKMFDYVKSINQLAYNLIKLNCGWPLYDLFNKYYRFLTISDYDIAPICASCYDYKNLLTLESLRCNNTKLLDIAILYFYFDDWANAYSIIKKLLEESTSPSPKMLYYYALLEIPMHERGHQQIKDMVKSYNQQLQSDEDNYYCALIYDLLGDGITSTSYLSNTSNNNYCQLLKESVPLIGEQRIDLINEIKPTAKNIEIDKDLFTQCIDYIRWRECIRYIDDEYIPESTYAFLNIKKEDKGTDGHIYNTIKDLELSAIKKYADTKVKKEKEVNPRNDQIEILYDLIHKVNRELEEADAAIQRNIDKNLNRPDTAENQIGMSIEKYNDSKNDDMYILLIWYYFKLGLISYTELTDLSLYLLFTSYKYRIKNTTDDAITMFFSGLGVGVNFSNACFLTLVLPLFNSGILKIMISCYNKWIKNDDTKGGNNIRIESLSNYQIFKTQIWEEIKKQSNILNVKIYDIDKDINILRNKYSQLDMYLQRLSRFS